MITSKQIQNDLDKSFLDEDDENYLSELTTRFSVQQKKSKKLNKKKNIRNCLNCYEEFPSRGSSNRLCDCCRKDAGYFE